MSCSAEHKPLFVKVGRMNKTIKEYCVNSGITYSDLFIKHGMGTLTGMDSIVLNGKTVSMGILSNFVQDKDVILVTSAPSTIHVRVGRVGSLLTTVHIEPNVSVTSILGAAGIHVCYDEDIWIHRDGELRGFKVSTDYVPQDGDIIVVEKKKDPRIAKIAEIMIKQLGVDSDYTMAEIDAVSYMIIKSIG